jgi:CRISPR-associated endonuclease/helicase Cas3
MNLDDLAALQTLTGFDPYRWQVRLFDVLRSGPIPGALDIPTGLGKTFVMGLWLAARALGAPVPRRLAYVVDRRVVVDQASKEAERLADNLEAALQGGVAECVAEAWRKNLGLAGERLPISTLRGQFTDNRLWLENPARSAIVVGTVDMIGSRMLFEGYSVRSGMRPVHAALLGNDTLVVLDEAHLVPPFEALLRRVAQADRPQPVPRLHVLALSATGSTAGKSDDVFRLNDAECDDPPVACRLDASKRVALRETDNLAQSLADRAFTLGEGGHRILIFCNSRDKLARVVAADLRKRSAKLWKQQETTALLVGARRVAERELLTGRRKPGVSEWEIPPHPVFRRFLPDEPEEACDLPAFLIATSAGEVGVDLDADHMVCDLVSWERMVQRLGRVNRTGRPEVALVDVYVAAPKEDPEDDFTEQLDLLRAPFQSSVWPTGGDGRRQAGPGMLRKLKDDPEFASLALAATTGTPLHPELSASILDAWAMTSLEHHPGRPKIEPWLRGWVEQTPQCRLVWRAVLPVRGDRPESKLLGEFFEAFPPHLTEVLETADYLITETLKTRSAALAKAGGKNSEDLSRLAAIILDPRGKVESMLTLRDLAEGFQPQMNRTVVVDARLGGLSTDGLLDSGTHTPPTTIDAAVDNTLWNEQRLEAVGRRLRVVTPGSEALPGWVREAAWPTTSEGGEEAPLEWRIEKRDRALTEGDPARSRTTQSLEDHLDWAVEEARRIARTVGLSDEQEHMLTLTAGLHDLGKDRELWQTAMGAPSIGRPFAKTDGRRANGRALGGYRHEFGSLRDAEIRLEEIANPDLRDLARHLLAAHHGDARPIIAPIDPSDPPSVAEGRSREVALRFVRLQRQWGPWGLAWWESLLRAADWAASARLVPQRVNERKAEEAP